MYQGSQHTKNFVEFKINLKFDVIAHFAFLFSVRSGMGRMGLRKSIYGWREILYIV